MYSIGNINFKHPPSILAPMDDVTDAPFRLICREFGADLVMTEFISADGILKKDDHFGSKLNFFPRERPLSVQLFATDPVKLTEAIQLIEPLHFDMLDLNMGCPVKKIVSKGAGAALLKDIPLMIKLSEAAVRAAKVPVTVKTRTGWDHSNRNIAEIALRLQDVGIAALTIHGRTKVQMYQGEADWEIIAQVKNNQSMHIPIIGNGDITTAEQAVHYQKKYGVDGIMIGRAAFGNPFIFKQIRALQAGNTIPIISTDERAETLKRHFELSTEWKGFGRTVFEIRKHYGGYFRHYPNFKSFRMKLMQAMTKDEVFEILDEVKQLYNNEDLNL